MIKRKVPTNITLTASRKRKRLRKLATIMDDVLDFFNFKKPFKRETISAGYIDGRTVPRPEEAPVRREDLGIEYVAEFRRAEDANLSRAFDQVEEVKRQRQATGGGAGHRAAGSRRSNLNDLDSQYEESDVESARRSAPDAGARRNVKLEPSSELETPSERDEDTEATECMDDEAEDEEAKPPKREKVHREPIGMMPSSVYDRYPFDTYLQPNLSIVASRAEILATIERNPVTVLQVSGWKSENGTLAEYIPK